MNTSFPRFCKEGGVNETLYADVDVGAFRCPRPFSPQEYAEAEMFLLWRLNGRLPTKAELGVAVTSTEYFGGLIDFTGEMGRFAVARATARDEVAVRTCLETDVYVSRSLHHNRLPAEAGCLVGG